MSFIVYYGLCPLHLDVDGYCNYDTQLMCGNWLEFDTFCGVKQRYTRGVPTTNHRDKDWIARNARHRRARGRSRSFVHRVTMSVRWDRVVTDERTRILGCIWSVRSWGHNATWHRYHKISREREHMVGWRGTYWSSEVRGGLERMPACNWVRQDPASGCAPSNPSLGFETWIWSLRLYASQALQPPPHPDRTHLTTWLLV